MTPVPKRLCYLGNLEYLSARKIMNNDSPQNRLSKMVTDWDGIRAAHDEGRDGDEVAAARNRILLKYSTCIYKYILGATRNSHAAEDLSQEFALRFVRGDYKNVDPAKGRFRDYLKTSLRNLVTDYFRKRQPTDLSTSAAEQIPESVDDNPLDSLEEEFQQNWRQQLLSHVWESLKQLEADCNNSYHTVLRHRAANPDSSSTEMAKALSKASGEEMTAEWVRQKIHRARQKFADLLVAEVRQSLSTTNEDEIQQEFVELGLQKYLR